MPDQNPEFSSTVAEETLTKCPKVKLQHSGSLILISARLRSFGFLQVTGDFMDNYREGTV